MATKKLISEQILRLFKGNPVIEGRIHINDVKLLVEQVANQLLKADYFSVSIPEGDSVVNNCMIYTYDSVPVTTYKTTLSKCTLPSIPVNLPRNMGVFSISKTDDINNPFIPIPSGMYGIIKPQDLIGEVSGLISYEVFGANIIFNKNLPSLGINNVMIRLVGVDLTTLSDYELLPLSADMEAQIVDTVFKMIVQAPPADRGPNVKD